MTNKKSGIKSDEHISSKNITDIYDLSVTLKLILLKGISMIPEVGPILSFLVSIFWPSAKANLWEQIYEKVESMIEAAELKLIKELLAGDIMFIQEKIKEVDIILNNHPGSQEAKNAFIIVSHTLVGFHKKLSSFDEKTNYILLPMYSLSVNLQLCFWINGIEKNKEIGLTEIELDELVSFCENTFVFSKKYINDLYEKNLDYAYNKSDATKVVDNIMSVQSHCSVHGLEHIYIWTQIMEKKTLSEKHDINFISYSSFFGRQTPKMMTLALTNEIDFPEPLKPQLINKKRNKITKVKGFIVRIGGAPRVAGIEISFNNGSDYSLGNTSTGEIVEFSLENEVIRRIEVWGTRAIDQLTFYLSDDRIYAFGQNCSNENKKFQISDSHHISGIYLASDDSTLAGQAANFCVSYEMDDLDSSDDAPSRALLALNGNYLCIK